MKGIIISSGSIKNYKLLESIARTQDFVLCADGGVDHILQTSILPDLVLGDLDSISRSGLKLIKDKNIPIEKHPSIKDSTDTELAVDYLIEKGFKDITLMGVTGSRQDHTMANIFLLNYLHERKIKAKIVDDNNIIYLIDNYIELEFKKNYYVSIVPITNNGAVISLDGFYYNLREQKIDFGSTIGISNKIIDNKGIIKIDQGKILVFISKD